VATRPVGLQPRSRRLAVPRKSAASTESFRVAGGEGVITRCVGGPSLFVVANMGGGPPQPAVSGDPVGATTWYARGPRREGHGCELRSRPEGRTTARSLR
jgi:hypothetical protein